MSSDEFLGDRKKALEESFFAKENQRLLEQMRAEKARGEAREALSEASGIRDEALLDRLVELELGPGTWSAISLIPLIEVAWADRVLDSTERKVILEAAEEIGVRPGKPSYELLESWLSEKPPGALLEAWGEYIVGIVSRLDSEGRNILHDEVLGRARAVAESAGGLLGWKTVSDAEKKVLAELERAFES